jgi:YbbR domain-containing protein
MEFWLLRHLWLKIISLVLAILTWLYVNGEIAKMVLRY